MSPETESETDGTQSPPQNVLLTYQEAFAHINDRLRRAEFSWAAELALSLVEQYPEDFDAQLTAGQCLLQAGQVNQSFAHIERAMSLREDAASAFFLKARALEHLNKSEQAFECINRALAIDPGNAEYLDARGSIYMSIADRENAIADFLEVLRINKRSIGALLKLSVIPGYELSREQVKMAEFLIQSGQLEQQQKGTAHFAVAGAYEKLGNRERQFKHLHAGNAIYSRLFRYEPEEFTRQVNQMIECFPASLFARDLPGSNSEARLVFIVGLPRTGSTLLEQILGCHSQVVTVGENNHLANAIAAFEENFSFPDMDERSLAALHRIANDYLAFAGQSAGGRVVVDKTLPNYMLSGLLRLLFPRARFIYTQRHPVATCYGAYKKLFSPGNVTFTYNLEHLAARYRDTLRMVRHWLEVIPDSYHVLDYESLVDNQEQVTRDILEFCELPWEDSCLNFHENASAVATASKMQVKQKIYSTAVSEWRQYEDYLAPLVELLGEEGGYPLRL